MPVNKKNTKRARVVTNDVGNYEKHPFFVRKNAEAIETLKKSGLPIGMPNNDHREKKAIAPRSQQVIPHQDGWAIKGLGNDKVTRVTPTQKEAIEVARGIARHHKSEVIIHGRDGRIRDKNNYGKASDKAPQKDHKH